MQIGIFISIDAIIIYFIIIGMMKKYLSLDFIINKRRSNY